MKYILIAGNPVDGFTFTGPFATPDEAHNAGEAIHGGDWWIGKLTPPED